MFSSDFKPILFLVVLLKDLDNIVVELGYIDSEFDIDFGYNKGFVDRNLM